MKKFMELRRGAMLLLLTGTLVSYSGIAQDSKDKKVIADAEEAKAAFIKEDALMADLFTKAYGYLILPNVGKGAVGIGGAAGNGAVYEQGKLIGMASMKQATIGFQLGGQSYREVILFESKAAMDRFKGDKFELSAQASAVAVTAGAAAKAKYAEGIMIFSQEKGGLMYEASVGGQKLNFKPF